MTAYDRVLRQRNRLLKEWEGRGAPKELDAWDEQLVEAGRPLMRLGAEARRRRLARPGGVPAPRGVRTRVPLRPNVVGEPLEERFARTLAERRGDELVRRTTWSGRTATSSSSRSGSWAPGLREPRGGVGGGPVPAARTRGGGLARGRRRAGRAARRPVLGAGPAPAAAGRDPAHGPRRRCSSAWRTTPTSRRPPRGCGTSPPDRRSRADAALEGLRRSRKDERTLHESRLGDVVDALLNEPAFARGKAIGQLAARWPDVVGPRLAAESAPVSLDQGCPGGRGDAPVRGVRRSGSSPIRSVGEPRTRSAPGASPGSMWSSERTRGKACSARVRGLSPASRMVVETRFGVTPDW